MDVMQKSTLSTPLTIEFVKPNWLKFIPQTSPDTHYSPRYLIPQFPLECIMVNVLLYRCCVGQIKSSRKSGRGAVMRPFVKTVYLNYVCHYLNQRINISRNRCKITKRFDHVLCVFNGIVLVLFGHSFQKSRRWHGSSAGNGGRHQQLKSMDMI